MLRVLAIVLIIVVAQTACAQHVRLYAVVLANDDPANFMAGSSNGSGLWQSDDTGRTWKQLGWKHIKAFSMDVDSNGRVLYLAAGNGILKSKDYGETWKMVTDWRVAEAMDVLIVKNRPGVILAATAHGVIRSTDYGASWRSSHGKIKQPYTSRLHSDGDVIYACNEEGLYRSTDDGIRWSLVSGCGNSVRAVSPFKDLTMTVGDHGICFTRHDGTVSSTISTRTLWTGHYSASLNKRLVAGPEGVGEVTQSDTIHFDGPKDVHALTSLDNQIFAGTLGQGIWMKNGLGGEWQAFALPKTQVWTMKAVYIR